MIFVVYTTRENFAPGGVDFLLYTTGEDFVFGGVDLFIYTTGGEFEFCDVHHLRGFCAQILHHRPVV